jgi:hypothetical protein
MMPDATSEVKPDAAQAVLDELLRFAAALFQPNDLVLVRLIETWVEGGKKKSRHVHTKHLTSEQLASLDAWHRLLGIAERERANVFFGVCPRARPGADKAHQILIVRALWADLDHVSVDEALARVARAGLPRPSAVIDSGHGAHLYWLLSEPCAIDDYPPGQENVQHGGKKKKPPLSPKAEKIQFTIRGIYQVIGGDHTHDLSRLLRLPGTWNRKDQRSGREPVPCVLVECDPDRRYPLADFERFVASQTRESLEAPEVRAKSAADPAAAFRPEAGITEEEALPAEARSHFERLVRECQSATDRSKADFAACCEAIRCGVEREAVWERLKDLGKTGERGRAYFDRTWEAAEEEVRKEGSACPSANGHDPSSPAGRPPASRSAPPARAPAAS